MRSRQYVQVFSVRFLGLIFRPVTATGCLKFSDFLSFQPLNKMGQQHNKVIKRKRRQLYLKRKKELDRSKQKLASKTRKDSDS